MPNHLHSIIIINEQPEIGITPTDHPAGPPPGSIGAIVGNYKMLVTKRVKARRKAIETDLLTWQRGYWERIIRNDRELNAIRKYIQENPLRWSEDRDNLDKLLSKMRYVDGV